MKAMCDVRGVKRGRVSSFSKALLAGSFVAVFCIYGTTALAEDFDLSSLAVPSSTPFGNSFTDLEPGETDTFEDSYSFAALSDASVSVLIDSIFGVSNLALTLFNDVGTVLASGATQITATPLLAGDYALTVAGLATGNQSGTTSYGGTLNLAATQVTPVPEPEIYAMMAVGMGIMGWAARRKKRRQAAAV